MNSPSISIIIPIYNAKKYLHDCLGDIIAQTYTNWECILVDDGSTDGSGAICDEYAASDLRIRVIHKENGGVSSARNRGISEAKGEWLTFIDADDRITPSFLENLIIKADDDVELVAGGNTYFGMEDGETVPPESIKVEHHDFKEYIFTKAEWTWQCIFQVVWGKLFRTSVIRKFGLLFDTNMTRSEDTTFMLLYMTKAHSVFLVNAKDYAYRYELSSKSYYKCDFEKFKNQSRAYKKAMAKVCESGIGNFKYMMESSQRGHFNILLSSLKDRKLFVHGIKEYKKIEREHDYLFYSFKHKVYYTLVLSFPSIGFFLIHKLHK